MLTTFAAFAVLSAPAAPVQLARRFSAGQTLRYDVRAELLSESREYGLNTWIPENLTIQYQSDMAVQTMKADGIAAIRYRRPTMTEIQGATFDTPERRRVDRTDINMLLDVTPINRIVQSRDLNPPKPTSRPGTRSSRWLRPAMQEEAMGQFFSQFIQEVYRLSLFVGPLDGSLDLAPRMPLDPVKVGDTWKETVSYAPQALKGRDGQLAVQRLDYTYTYRGLMTVNNRQVHRVTADLAMSADLAAFLHQMADAKPEDTGLRSFPLNLKANIEFDLDPKTFHTLRAVATSEGGFSINLTQIADRPVVEQRLKGRTVMRLLPAAAPARKP